jgi:methyltransferase-like protein 6
MVELPEEYVEYAENILKTHENMPEFWRTKYLSETRKSWDLFYKRNKDNFYKDRNWTSREFPELADLSNKSLLEVGCGVGNFILPLINLNRDRGFKAFSCDFSESAIEILKQHPESMNGNLTPFCADIVNDKLTDYIEPHSIDIISMIFVLSAVKPEEMERVIQNIKSVLKPNGRILFRDYGRYDAAQLRFKNGNKMEDNLYVRQDGTLAYYFTVNDIQRLFEKDFEIIQNEYVFKSTVNRKMNLDVRRIFVQANMKIKA